MARRKYRVLVVDDREVAADILAKLLRKKGQEVHTAYDGEQAIEAAERLRPEVVYSTSECQRWTATRSVAISETSPGARAMYLVALTGWGQEEDRRRSEDAGFNCHLVKPVRSAVLMKLLASITAAGGDQPENTKA